jgi:hypothetical protein
MNSERYLLPSSLVDSIEPARFNVADLQSGRTFATADGGTVLVPPRGMLLAQQLDGVTAKQLLHPKRHDALISNTAPPPAHTHKWEFVNVIGRRRAGLDQAAVDAINLQDATNSDFVDRISEDCHVGPHLETAQFLGGFVGKGIVKGTIGKLAGQHLGPVGKWVGLGSGVTLAAIGGAYFAYETSELMENSCKISNYEKRFAQGITSGTTTMDPEEVSPLGPLNLPYGIEKHWPSVREVVDAGKEPFARAYYHMRGKEVPDDDLEIFKLVDSKSALDDRQFMSWAQKESKPTYTDLAEHHGGFLAMGSAGGFYVTRELKMQLPSASLFDDAGRLHFRIKNPWSAAILGSALVGAFLLSELGVKAKEYTKLAELYTARLITKPYDHPKH